MKIVDNLGKLLILLLLLMVVLLSIVVIFNFEFVLSVFKDKYIIYFFILGSLEGYFIMDFVVVLVFLVVIVNGYKFKGFIDCMKILKYVCFLGFIVVILFGMIYFVFVYVGVLMVLGNFKDGIDILMYNLLCVFGLFGNFVFGMMVIFVCLIICIGFVNVCVIFIKKYVFKFFYKIFVFVFFIIGFLFIIFGLEMILKIVVLLLILIYFVFIVFVLILFVNMFSIFRFSWVY